MQRKRIRCTVAAILAMCLMMGGISVCGDEAENGNHEILSRANSAACLLGQNFPGPFGSSIAFVGLDFLKSESSTSIDEPELLEATEEDVAKLTEILSCGFFPTATCDFHSVAMETLITYIVGEWGNPETFLYGCYFDVNRDEIRFEMGQQPPVPIPLETGLDYYTRYPAKNIDWIIRNILHAEPDHTVWNEEQGIIYQDDFYYVSCWATGGPSHTVEIDDLSRNETGRYTVKCTPYIQGDKKYPMDSLQYTCDLQLVDGKRCWTFYRCEPLDETEQGEPELLEATEEDIEILGGMLGSISTMSREFDVTTDSAEDLLENVILYYGLGCYSYYWQKEGTSFITESEAEDLGLTGPFNGYDVYSGDKVDWILKNIFHTEPDHSIQKTVPDETGVETYTQLCYLSGNYYQWNSGVGNTSFKIEIDPAKRKGNGTYEITCKFTSMGVDGTVADAVALRFTCDLRLIEHVRCWTFYRCELVD